MERTNCCVCGSDCPELLMLGKDRLHDVPGTFRVVRCQECGLIYLNPRPERGEMEAYYPPEYMPYTTAIQDEASPLKRLDRQYGLSKRIDAVHSLFQRPGRVLDVGCATGVFLDGMRAEGWKAYGVDTSPWASQYARERLQLDVLTGEVADASFPDGHFHLVTLWDVLEHVHDPRATLLETARILRPGGLLVMTLPNLDSWEASLFGPNWVGWDVPRHLHLFPKTTLDRLLRETGFQMQQVRFFTGRYYVFVLSADCWLKDRLVRAPVRRIITRVLYSWPMRLMAIPLYVILDGMGKSSIMTVYARRLG